ncbi:MAG: YbfB/YjiJ family MFS transporter [Pseudomonadota bacterium]
MAQAEDRSDSRDVLLALGGLVSLVVAMGIGRFIFTPILPDMEAALGWTKADAGLVASANYLGYLIGALAAAWMALPGGARRWFLIALLVSAMTTMASGLFTSLTPLLVVRFLGGLASAFVLVLASTLVLARLTQRGRAELFSLHFAGVGVGIALSGVLVGVLSAAGSGWSTFWTTGGIVSLAGCAFALWAVPAHDAGDVGGGAAVPARATRFSRRVWQLVFSYGLFGFGYVILATFISAMVREAPEVRWLEVPIWVIVGLAAIPSVAFWSLVSARAGTGFAYAASAAMQAVGTALALTGSAAGLIFSAITLGGSMVSLTAIGFLHAKTLTDQDGRVVLGLMTAAFGLGQVVGPLLAGVLAEATGSFSMALVAASLSLALCAVLTPGGWPRRVAH